MKLKNLFPSASPGKGFPEEEEICCGKHKTCLKMLSKKQKQQPAVEYYDDEELDIFRNRRPDSYTAEETAQFAEILHTLWKSDVAGWLASLKQREIALPENLQKELEIS